MAELKMKIFVFGGTQFLGRLTVEALLNMGHKVVLFNRCRTSNPFEGHSNAKCVKCDRIGDREDFKASVRAQGDSDVVIDFIGFQEIYARDALEALTRPSDGARRFSTRHYIFISSDAVYWAQKVPCVGVRICETDARDFSPSEFAAHLKHCQKTPLGDYQLRYGSNKLKCERVFEEAWQNDGFPYTILRLADMYGPYDNLGGFWELVMAIEGRWPIPTGMPDGRMRLREGQILPGSGTRRFSWIFAEDARDAILACVAKGSEVHGVTMHVAHEEAVNLRETVEMIMEAMNLTDMSPCFDDDRDAVVPSSDFGTLDVSKALRLLRPWRPTTMRLAVRRSVSWFFARDENRRYHRIVHRELRYFDEANARFYICEVRTLPCCWVGAIERISSLQGGPIVLKDSLSKFTGHAVLAFMHRLMEQAGDMHVTCELQRFPAIEQQIFTLRHFAGNLLVRSKHTLAYRLETSQLLESTDILPQLTSPLSDAWGDKTDACPTRLLRIGGVGARTKLRRVAFTNITCANDGCGVWDCALLGRRKWRLFPPETPLAALCAPRDSIESPVDCYAAGPDTCMVHTDHVNFSPKYCLEYEQTMGDTVVVPHGWWYQTYDDDRTLSIAANCVCPGAGIQKHTNFITEKLGKYAEPRLDCNLAQDGRETAHYELVD